MSVFFVMSSSVFALKPTAAETKFASKSDFASAIVGKHIQSTTKKGKVVTVTYKSGGIGDVQIEGDKLSKTTWTFNGTTVCLTVPDWSFTECNNVELVDANTANFFDAKTGKLSNTYSIK